MAARGTNAASGVLQRIPGEPRAVVLLVVGHFCGSQACAAALCLRSCQLGGASGSVPRVLKVEPEARHSQLGNCVEIVSKGKGDLQ